MVKGPSLKKLEAKRTLVQWRIVTTGSTSAHLEDNGKLDCSRRQEIFVTISDQLSYLPSLLGHF